MPSIARYTNSGPQCQEIPSALTTFPARCEGMLVCHVQSITTYGGILNTKTPTTVALAEEVDIGDGSQYRKSSGRALCCEKGHGSSSAAMWRRTMSHRIIHECRDGIIIGGGEESGQGFEAW